MEAKQLVLQRGEPVVFDGEKFHGIFGNEVEAARLRNRLERVSQNHKIHVSTMEPHEELPLHIHELIGTWHRGAIVRPKNGRIDHGPAPGYGRRYKLPKP